MQLFSDVCVRHCLFMTSATCCDIAVEFLVVAEWFYGLWCCDCIYKVGSAESYFWVNWQVFVSLLKLVKMQQTIMVIQDADKSELI